MVPTTLAVAEVRSSTFAIPAHRRFLDEARRSIELQQEQGTYNTNGRLVTSRLRARVNLLSCLTTMERQVFREMDYRFIAIRDQKGRPWSIGTTGWESNTVRHDSHGCYLVDYCVATKAYNDGPHGYEYIPADDQFAGQILALRFNVKALLAKGVPGYRYACERAKSGTKFSQMHPKPGYRDDYGRWNETGCRCTWCRGDRYAESMPVEAVKRLIHKEELAAARAA